MKKQYTINRNEDFFSFLEDFNSALEESSLSNVVNEIEFKVETKTGILISFNYCEVDGVSITDFKDEEHRIYEFSIISKKEEVGYVIVNEGQKIVLLKDIYKNEEGYILNNFLIDIE